MLEAIIRDTPGYRDILEEGKQQGLHEGKQQGLHEGKQQGLLDGLRDSIVVLTRVRYPDLEATARTRAASLPTREALERLLARISQAANEDVVRALLVEKSSC